MQHILILFGFFIFGIVIANVWNSFAIRKSGLFTLDPSYFEAGGIMGRDVRLYNPCGRTCGDCGENFNLDDGHVCDPAILKANENARSAMQSVILQADNHQQGFCESCPDAQKCFDDRACRLGVFTV